MSKIWKKFTLISLVFALGLWGSGQTKNQPGENFSDLEELLQKILRDLRNRDADAVLSVYGRPLEFVHIDNGKVIPWEKLEPQVRKYLGSVKKNEIYWVGTPKIIRLGQDAAVVYGTHQFAGDGTREPHKGEWTGIFQRMEGRWRLVHSHSSDEKH